MTTTLTKLPGSKWFIETEDSTSEIVGTYNKAAIITDIAAIRETLLQYPDPTQGATDTTAILTLITNSGWTAVRKTRVTALVNAMYQAYQGNPRNLEAAQLQARLDALIILRDRLV
jgi:hypothetical protein